MFNNKAMVADLTVSLWNARKYDAKVTEDAAIQHQADVRSGRYTKALLNPDLLKPIARARTALEDYHKSTTAPWHQGGGRLLPSIKFMTYTTEMRQLKNAFLSEVHTFVAGYQAEVQRAQASLGTMYDASDYPDVKEVRAKFDVVIDLTPLPELPDWRLTLVQEAADEAAEAMKETYERKEKAMVASSYQRAREVVQKMYEALSDPDKIFRDSLVGNVEAVADLLPALNLTNDPDLDNIAATMKASLCIPPNTLRSDPEARQKAALTAGSILSAIAPKLATP